MRTCVQPAVALTALGLLWVVACGNAAADDQAQMPVSGSAEPTSTQTSSGEMPIPPGSIEGASPDDTEAEGNAGPPPTSSSAPGTEPSGTEPSGTEPSGSQAPEVNTGDETDAPGPSSTQASDEPAPSNSGAPSQAPSTSPKPPFDPNDPANIPPGSGPLGVETTCDGMDDDLNGVIDDVDVGADGVCDCLRIATLGLHGEWGDGNVFTGWFAERSSAAVTSLGEAEITAETLAPFHILVIEDVSTNHTPGLSYSAAEAQVLWDWVRQGGGLITLIGYSDAGEASNVNALLQPFDLSYASEPILSGGGAPVAVSEWFEHRLTQGVTAVGADNGYAVEGQGTVIAAQDGSDVGKAVIIGDGHVLVWGDEWVTYETEWSGDASYQVDKFWLNTLDWLARANQCHVPQP